MSAKPPTTRKQMLASTRPVLFNLLSALFLAVMLHGLVFTASWDWTKSFSAIFAAALAALIGNLERIDSMNFSASGFQAKMRQVETALQEVQRLAVMTVAVLVDLIAAGGRWSGSGSIGKKDAQKETVLEMLRSLKLSGEQIEEVARADHRWVVIDYVGGIFGNVAQVLNKSGRGQEWGSFMGPFNESLERPSPDEISTFLNRLDLMNDFRRELIEDYKFYLSERRHRRPNVWKSRDEWPD